MPKTKILILYTAIGQGHKTIAENLGRVLAGQEFEIRLEDIHKVQAGSLVTITTAIHQLINRHVPIIWRWLYLSDTVIYLGRKFRMRLARRHSQRTLALIEEFDPAVIIATQTTASAVIAYLKAAGLTTARFGIAFSDFHLHQLWLYPQTDFYLCNIEEQKQEMVELGVPAGKIFVCGMLVEPLAPADVESERLELGVLTGTKVVLVGTGSQGIGLSERKLQDFLERLLAKFNRIGLKVKIFVVCGKNAKLAARLKTNLNHEAISVLGFFTPMARLYRIADAFVTKPGGLSITEALSYQLPCAILYSLPGQEELNIDYLRRASLIMPPVSRRQPDVYRLILQVVEEVRTGDFRRILRKNPQLAAVVKTQLPDEVLQLLHS